MSKVLLRMGLDRSLRAMDDEAKEALSRIKAGRDVWCEIRQARNPKQHRLYFGLLTLVWENLPEHLGEIYQSVEVLRKAVQIKAGFVDPLVTLDGEIISIPRSMAWDQLDQDEFAKLFPRVMAVCAELLGGVGLHELEEELARFAA